MLLLFQIARWRFRSVRMKYYQNKIRTVRIFVLSKFSAYVTQPIFMEHRRKLMKNSTSNTETKIIFFILTQAACPI